MKPSIQDAAQNISATAETTPGFSHDVFALTDEQILEIQPDQTVDPQRDSEQAGSELLDSASRTFAPADPQPVNAAATGSPSVVTLDAQPPRWLADMMADARSGGEARDFWNGVTQARQESAAYREVFPEPAAARHAADRAHTLDEIDRAYFAGDPGQRSQLAARMMQQDPAAFREMVFAGLRALETGQAGASALGSTREALTAVANPSTNTAATLAAATQPDAILSAYSTFEKSANEELERTVGGAIHRTLEQALPSNGRADSATLKTRLVAEIRQDATLRA